VIFAAGLASRYPPAGPRTLHQLELLGEISGRQFIQSCKSLGRQPPFWRQVGEYCGRMRRPFDTFGHLHRTLVSRLLFGYKLSEFGKPS
jgi:hypothetical protein